MLVLILITTIVAIIMYLFARKKGAYSVKFKNTVVEFRVKKWVEVQK